MACDVKAWHGMARGHPKSIDYDKFEKFHRDNSYYNSHHSKGSWLLATCLIPGCVGRGEKFGSESSSACASAGAASDGVWKFGKLDSTNMQQIKMLKMKIRHAQNDGRVLIGRKKPPDPFWVACLIFFSMGQQTATIIYFFAIFLGGPIGSLAAVQPWSRLGGQIGCKAIKIRGPNLKLTM